jgi:hypothetical protein
MDTVFVVGGISAFPVRPQTTTATATTSRPAVLLVIPLLPECTSEICMTLLTHRMQ